MTTTVSTIRNILGIPNTRYMVVQYSENQPTYEYRLVDDQVEYKDPHTGVWKVSKTYEAIKKILEDGNLEYMVLNSRILYDACVQAGWL